MQDELLEITAVVDIPDNSQLDYDLFLPVTPMIHNSWTWRDPSYVMLHPDTDKKAFEGKLVTYFNETLPSELPGNHQLKLVAIEKANLAFGKRKEFLLFSGIAILILLIVAINYMNLSTANYTKRIREMGIRKIMGATPRILRKQLFAETLIQTSAAMFMRTFPGRTIASTPKLLFNTTVQIGYKEKSTHLCGLRRS